MQVSLYFFFLSLSQQQHLIELIRKGNLEGALDYAQTHLAERGEENSEILPELERTLALLAFENPETSPFADLMHPSQRQKVRGQKICKITNSLFLPPFPHEKWFDSLLMLLLIITYPQ